MRKLRILSIAAVTWPTAASPAFACSVCVAAALDHVIPPILYWSAISVIWFLAMAILSSVTRHRIRGQPPLPWAIGIGAFAAFLGVIALGPIALLALALPPTYAAIRTVLARPDEAVPARVRKAVILIGLAHVVAAGVGIGLTLQTLRTRTEAMYICEWSGTAPGRGEFQLLRKQEPDSIESYRYIVQHGTGWVVAEAAERLGSIGDPARDAEVLRRARVSAGDDPEASAAIDAALKVLDERRGNGV